MMRSTLFVACWAAGCSTSEPTPDARVAVAPRASYTEASPVALPAGSSTIEAIAIDGSSHTLFVASGATILRDDVRSPRGLTTFATLATQGIATVNAMQVTTGGGLVVASADAVLVLTADGTVVSRAAYTSPFPAPPFGAPALAIARDGRAMYLVESGSGSPGETGQLAVHVAAYDLSGVGTLASQTFELGAPFELVPSTTAAINAAAPVVSADSATLYVAHVVLREVFAVEVAAPHRVSVVDTDSLQRSATAMALDGDLLTQAAVFDQTVPVFRTSSATAATLLAEIPVGNAPGVVASDGRRIVVSMTAGFGLPGGGGSSAPPATLRVFDLAEAP